MKEGDIITLTPKRVFAKTRKDGSLVEGINDKTGKEWKIFTILTEDGRYYSIFHNSHEGSPDIRLGERQDFKITQIKEPYNPTIQKLSTKKKADKTGEKITMDTLSDLQKRIKIIEKVLNDKVSPKIGDLEERMEAIEEGKTKDGYATK